MDEDGPKAIVGRDGYLFLGGDSNRSIDQLEGRLHLGADACWAIASAHAARTQLCEAQLQASYLHVVAPNKETVLWDFLPPHIQPRRNGLTPLEQYLGSRSSELHRPFYSPDLLKPGPDGAPQSFLRSDTHWTYRGAFEYFIAALATRSPWLAGTFASVETEQVQVDIPGDLGSKLGAPPERASVARVATPQAHLVYDNGLEYHGRVRVYDNPNASTGPAIILHDSFLEWILPQIAECFSRCYFIQSIHLDLDLLLRIRPTFVLCEQVERFFIRVPAPSVSLRELVKSSRNGYDVSLEAFERFVSQ